jgi:hypothetical protein
MTSRAIGWQVQLLDGVSLLGGIGETVSHAKPLPNVKAQGMAGRSPCHSLPLLVGCFVFCGFKNRMKFNRETILQ